MEPEVSVSCSQDTAIRPYSEQDESGRTSLFMSLRYVLILSSHVHPGVISDFFLSDFPKKVLHAFFTCPLHDTYPVHLFRIDMAVFSMANVDVDFPYKLPPPMQFESRYTETGCPHSFSPHRRDTYGTEHYKTCNHVKVHVL
jgi:hypothetical protein